MRAADITAVLDANVLYPVSLCDTLLRCALAGLFVPLWTSEIIAEFTRNLVADGRATQDRADRRSRHMSMAFPEALVTGYEELIPLLACDPKDRHVLAAAIRGRAHLIVTQNLIDFPEIALRPFGIETRHPDLFLVDLYEQQPAVIVEIIHRQAAALQNPPMTSVQVLDALSLHTPAFATVARSRI